MESKLKQRLTKRQVEDLSEAVSWRGWVKPSVIEWDSEAVDQIIFEDDPDCVDPAREMLAYSLGQQIEKAELDSDYLCLPNVANFAKRLRTIQRQQGLTDRELFG